MPKEEWGTKRLCPTTGKRFYDLNKTPVISPYTGEVVVLDLPGRKGVTAATESNKSKPKASEDMESDDVLLDDDDDDVSVDTDDELLEDEDDDTVSFDELGDVAGEGDDES
ncbi:TIGR02300 family protein [Cereibacter sphaeroides]|nr:TIGR02300 family protein [Cereibacter sphaeroides]